jgi:chemotaxis protein methyltransferase CheR
VTAKARATSELMMSDAEFAKLRELIQRETGIHLVAEKKHLLMGRLSRRMRELGLTSFTAYYRRVIGPDDAAERQRMVDLISTNETRFFREPPHFTFLEQRIIPEWLKQAETRKRPRRVRVWSAACATGEEPYSLAMTLRHHVPKDWSIEIVASDVSTRALERARDAVYSMERVEEIPKEYVRAYMLRGVASQLGNAKVAPEIRSMVQLVHMNLNDERYPIAGPFDVIFCRNVFIYFDGPAKVHAVERVLDRLAPNGYLFLGRSESLHGITTRVRTLEPAVYELMPAGLRRPSSTRMQRVTLEAAQQAEAKAKERQ